MNEAGRHSVAYKRKAELEYENWEETKKDLIGKWELE